MLYCTQTPINKTEGASDPKLTYLVGGKDNSKLFYHRQQAALHIVVACSRAPMLFHIQTLYICPLSRLFNSSSNFTFTVLKILQAKSVLSVDVFGIAAPAHFLCIIHYLGPRE